VESPTGTLVVRRPPRRRRDVLLEYQIDVNETPWGLLGPGQTLVWQLSSDAYRVQARVGRTGSTPIDVEVRDRSTVWLAVEPQAWWRSLLSGVGTTGYLTLCEVEGNGRWTPAFSDGTDLAGASPAAAREAVEAASRPPVPDMPAGRWLHGMTTNSVAPTAWIVALTVTCVGSVVLALDFVASQPGPVLVAAAVTFLAGLVSFGVLGYVEARRSGSGYWSALWNAIRAFLRALRHLFP
jgi:hypothetical protein